MIPVPATPRWGGDGGGAPSGLRTFYVAGVGRRGSTLGEAVIIVSNHFLQNSADHFAATCKRKKLLSQVRFGKDPNPQCKKQGPHSPPAAPGLGGGSWVQG